MNGDGLSTSVLPASSAGAIFQKASVSGKFHGVMAATTPSGRRATSTKAVVVVLDDLRRRLEVGEVLAPDGRGEDLDAGVGQGLALLGGQDRRQLGTATPCSTSAALRRAARRAASSTFQSRDALAAASKAASSCWRVHSGASAKTSPVAGLRTPNVPSVGCGFPRDGHHELGHGAPRLRSEAGLPRPGWILEPILHLDRPGSIDPDL